MDHLLCLAVSELCFQVTCSFSMETQPETYEEMCDYVRLSAHSHVGDSYSGIPKPVFTCVCVCVYVSGTQGFTEGS